MHTSFCTTPDLGDAGGLIRKAPLTGEMPEGLGNQLGGNYPENVSCPEFMVRHRVINLSRLCETCTTTLKDSEPRLKIDVRVRE